MGRSSEKKDKTSKKDKRKQKEKEKEPLQPQAPPRTIPVPHAPPLPPNPAATTNIQTPPADSQPTNNQVQVSGEHSEAARPHTSGQELNATVSTGKRARSPNPVADARARKREKKLSKILSYMYHDTHSDT